VREKVAGTMAGLKARDGDERGAPRSAEKSNSADDN